MYGSQRSAISVAIKTGTSTNFHDAWAVAWSSRYLVGVWVGYPDFRPMNHLSGYLSAADLVQKMLLVLHRDQTDGLAELSFPPPRGWQPARVFALTGHRATDACDQVFLELFRPGEEPVHDCRVHPFQRGLREWCVWWCSEGQSLEVFFTGVGG